MSILNIIKASAGSGKTHYLTGSVLRQLYLEHSPEYFRHILAVTFTNKATAEMKSRLLEELHRLAGGKPSDYISMLTGLGSDPEQIRRKAGILLNTILHEYSWLSIETIDSFFQRVIRSFTRELGIPGNFIIELDTDAVLEFAVDGLLDSLGNDTDLLQWLMLFAEERIQEGKTWDFRNDLLELGGELFKEQFSDHATELEKIIADRNAMREFRDQLFAIKGSFEKFCMETGAKAVGLIRQHQLTDNDFYQKRNGAFRIFRKLESAELTSSNGELITRLRVFEKLLENPANWAAKDSDRKTEVEQLASGQLFDLLTRAVEFIGKGYTRYRSARILINNLYELGILVDLSGKVRQYRFEKNAFLLADSSVLINRLINHNDTPFIYEKMGNRYANYFIDEFQDTSQLQWRNFKPLLSNSLAQSKDCLVVGDIKQSVYRWRNGDWEILARQIVEEYPQDIIRTRTLSTNWRSDERIVSFNSLIFDRAVNLLKRDLMARLDTDTFDFDPELQLLVNAFSDVVQETAQKNRNKGNVLVRFFRKEEFSDTGDLFADALAESLDQLLKMPYDLRDIAIIVRDKKQGRKMADFLMESNRQNRFGKELSFISEESLLISSSVIINLILAALRCLSREEERLYGAELQSAFAMYQKYRNRDSKSDIIQWQNLPDGKGVKLFPEAFEKAKDHLRSLPLYEMTENLVSVFEIQSDLAYVHAFLDLVFEFGKSDQASLESFLKYWEDRGQYKTVPASDSQDAIRILTIHKAKGLEFPAVLLPFCNWNFNQKANSIFWVDMPQDFISGVPVFPVNYTKALKDTIFAEAYYREMYRSYVDNLNLLYVAMTRAKESLIAFPVYRDPEKRKGSIDTVGDLLYDVLTADDQQLFTEYFSAESDVLKIGFAAGRDEAGPESETADERIIQSAPGKPAMDRLFFTTAGIDYFSEEYSRLASGMIRGQLLHGILAEIKTSDDLESAMERATAQRTIPEQEAGLLKEHINKCITDPIVSSWFNGSGEILNETDILLPNGNIKRPDRIIIRDDRIDVVDYKFGRDKEEPAHHKQVQEYMQILKAMGFPRVYGFLWYIDLNEVIEVKKYAV